MNTMCSYLVDIKLRNRIPGLFKLCSPFSYGHWPFVLESWFEFEIWLFSFHRVFNTYVYKKAVLPQGNRAMPQVFFSVDSDLAWVNGKSGR